MAAAFPPTLADLEHRALDGVLTSEPRTDAAAQEHPMPDQSDDGASDPDLGGQDLAEVWDEDNRDSDARRLALGDDEMNADELPDVYDATRRVGDDSDDDALIGEDMDDADIIELARDDDEDDEDPEDDPYRLRAADAFDDEDDDPLDLDDETDLDAAVSRTGPNEVQLEDAGDLNNREGAFGSARRFESSRLSDDDIERLGYGPEEPRSFDPADKSRAGDTDALTPPKETRRGPRAEQNLPRPGQGPLKPIP